jgi:hypothetical protein
LYSFMNLAPSLLRLTFVLQTAVKGPFIHTTCSHASCAMPSLTSSYTCQLHTYLLGHDRAQLFTLQPCGFLTLSY